jgi:hypothetical protein
MYISFQSCKAVLETHCVCDVTSYVTRLPCGWRTLKGVLCALYTKLRNVKTE